MTTKRKILLGSKEQRMNRIFGKENEQILKELGYHKMNDVEQYQFREKIIRESFAIAFAKSKEETA